MHAEAGDEGTAGVVATGAVSAKSDAERVADAEHGRGARDNPCMASGANTRDRAGGRRRPRRGLVTVLLVLGSAAALAGSFALWLDRQALSPSGWQTTSSQLIASPQIRRTLGTFAVDELLRQTNAAEQLHALLPASVADPLLDRLRALGLRLAAGILTARPARVVWNAANRQAHRDLLRILERGGTRGEVTLNLEPLLVELVRALHADPLVQALPGGGKQLFTLGSPGAGAIPILSADQVDKARAVVNAIRGLSILLTAAAFGLFGVAVTIARGWRAAAVRRVGICLTLVGTLVLVLRAVIAPQLADALVASSTYRPAARAAWTISTTELRDLAIGMIVVGGLLFAAGLAGGAAGRRVRPR